MFVTTDLHGCRDSFLALLDRIAFSRSDTLYLLGDYVAKGPDSRGVLDEIMTLQQSGYRILCLRGNHEEMLLRAVRSDPASLEGWMPADGKRTLTSFGVEKAADLPPEYVGWLDELPYFFETDGYILVHAGLDFSAPDPLAATGSMCWIRDWHETIRYDWLGERVILHGHTPVPPGRIRSQFARLDTGRFLDLDGGCAFAGNPRPERAGLGWLAAFDMTNRRLFFQKNIDRPAPHPISTF